MSDKMQRFTRRSRVVLQLTQQAAERLGSTTIESEHLLIGISMESRGVGGEALRRLGVTASKIVTVLPRNPLGGGHPVSAIHLSKDVKRILEYSVDEARRRGSMSIHTEHLLLGMLRLESCRAVQVLKEMKVEPARLHAEIRTVQTTAVELRSPTYDQPRTVSEKPPSSQFIQQAADESVRHTEMLYDRIAKRQKGPNLAITVGIALIGTIITALWADHSMELAIRWPVLAGFRTIVIVLSWIVALLLPAVAAGLSSLIVTRDIQQDTIALLRLTNVNSASLMAGYVRGVLYRLRLLFPPVLMVLPIIVLSVEEIVRVIIQWFPQSTGLQPQIVWIGSAFISPGFLLWTLIAFIWAGIGLGVAISFKLREGTMAIATASLTLLSSLLVTVALTVLGMNMMVARAFAADPNTFDFSDVEALLYLPPLLAFIAGLVAMRQGQKWIAPDEDQASKPKHPLER